MRFAIRDDDTNFFTSPEELEACYGDIWDAIPPTLCLISKVKGNWKHWVHQIYKDKQQTDWAAWTADNTAYPIEDNAALVSFLQKKIKDGKLDVGFHAKYHRNEDAELPQNRENNYVRGAEFFTERDMMGIIQQEVTHLDKILQTQISVFTPPQNLLSPKGYEAVVNSGLNICGGGIPFFKKEKTPQGIANIAKVGLFKVQHRGVDYPHVLHYSRHNEISYHYPLQPTTQLQTLINAFEQVRRFDGDFVLSTHYVEFDYPMTYDAGKTMKGVLLDFLNYIEKYKVEKMSLSKLLSN